MRISEISQLAKTKTTVAVKILDPPKSKPCEVCNSILHWIDIYGGGPHCHVCDPWPDDRFVRRLVIPGGDGRWIDRLAQVADEGVVGDCAHRRMRRAVVGWPALEASAGGLMRIDWERETETFAICGDCGAELSPAIDWD